MTGDDLVEALQRRRNMRPLMEGDGRMRDELHMEPYHVMARKYDDDVGRAMRFVGYTCEAIMDHLAITPSDGAPPHYTYIPSWEERWAEHKGGVGTSRAGDGNDDEEE